MKYILSGQTMAQARKKQCPGNLSFDLSSQHRCLVNNCQAWKWKHKSRNWRVLFWEPRGECMSVNIKDSLPKRSFWNRG
jgi:hypothetical protein